ncbi:MG284/MPN403 family protein [Mycoplasmopsis iners]|uniref:MG284/MPN403 family protein n=1 Tax=Mycoplasmopsis iners TaxID=76630 RepID=UPI0038CDAA2F
MRYDSLYSYYQKNKNCIEKKLSNFYSEAFAKTLNCLSSVSSLIITNQFLTKNTNKYWYSEYFSKTTYYKKRIEAIDEFLSYYIMN